MINNKSRNDMKCGLQSVINNYKCEFTQKGLDCENTNIEKEIETMDEQQLEYVYDYYSNNPENLKLRLLLENNSIPSGHINYYL